MNFLGFEHLETDSARVFVDFSIYTNLNLLIQYLG